MKKYEKCEKCYNLNETEVRDSDFKNAFPGIFDFTVGILPETLSDLVVFKLLENH